jgi:type II restriction/modification system DNA methylase subunit YeeA
MIYQTKCPSKQAGVAIHTSDKVDFKPKLDKRYKENPFIVLIKAAIHPEKITIINLHVPNISALNFIKHTLMDLKIQRDPNTKVADVFHTPLSPKDRN